MIPSLGWGRSVLNIMNNVCSHLRLLIGALIVLCSSGSMYADQFRLFIPLDSLKQLELHYPRDSFSLSMIPPEDAGAEIYYSWRLDGLDEEWTSPSARPLISYEGLSPGKYRLDVRMHDGGRMTERHLYLMVIPPFWMTARFYAIVCLLVIVIVSIVVYYYIKGIRRRTAFEKLLIYQMLDRAESPLAIGMNPMRVNEEAECMVAQTVIDVEATETDSIAEEGVSEQIKEENPEDKAADEEFLERALQCVRENISNEAFGKGDFASAMMISQSLLYKKLKAITDMSVVEFIRSIRLNYAMTLLRSGDYNVTEVSEKCGFSSSAYFSRVFKDNFGKSPSEIIPGKEMQKNDQAPSQPGEGEA